MSAFNDGGPAYARPKSRDPDSYMYPETYPAQDGMSLRDYFAAKAMAGQAQYEGMEGNDPEHWAAMAYQVADAMIAERSRREAQP